MGGVKRALIDVADALGIEDVNSPEAQDCAQRWVDSRVPLGRWSAEEVARRAEFVTLTVVVRRDADTAEDPCDVVLRERSDVLFVGCQDGVSGAAFAAGADPSSWPDL